MDLEGIAYEHSEPGIAQPVYQGPRKDAREGWRRNTPMNIDYLIARKEDQEEREADD